MPWGDRETFLDGGWVHSERDRGREMLTSQCPQDLSALYLIHDAPRDVVHVSWELTSLWVTVANEEVLCFRLEFTSICGIASSSTPPWACLPGLPWLAVHHRLGWTAFSIFIWRLHNGIFFLVVQLLLLSVLGDPNNHSILNPNYKSPNVEDHVAASLKS